MRIEKEYDRRTCDVVFTVNGDRLYVPERQTFQPGDKTMAYIWKSWDALLDLKLRMHRDCGEGCTHQ